jgi:hypothetical protein
LALAEAVECRTTWASVQELTAESYGNPETILEQACKRNTHVYLCYSSTVLIGFFMTGWSLSPFGIQKTDVPIAYVGLTVVANRQKGRGIGTLLFKSFLTEGKHLQEKVGGTHFFWFTTASPQFAKGWWNLTGDIAPTRSGEFDDQFREMLKHISGAFGMDRYASAEHPFLFRGCTKVRYSEHEIQRLDRIFSERREHLFTKYDVDETRGDRLLFIGKIPQLQDGDVMSTVSSLL